MTELAHIEKIVFLQSVGLFSFCRAEEILRLAAIAHERPVRADEQIYDVNDPADVFFCVVSGQITLESPDGESDHALPHQTFGGLEILRGRLRSSSTTLTQLPCGPLGTTSACASSPV